MMLLDDSNSDECSCCCCNCSFCTNFGLCSQSSCDTFCEFSQCPFIELSQKTLSSGDVLCSCCTKYSFSEIKTRQKLCDIKDFDERRNKFEEYCKIIELVEYKYVYNSATQPVYNTKDEIIKLCQDMMRIGNKCQVVHTWVELLKKMLGSNYQKIYKFIDFQFYHTKTIDKEIYRKVWHWLEKLRLCQGIEKTPTRFFREKWNIWYLE